MKFHRNTIIALAVLAVFVVCVSIAKVSLANPFSSKASPTPAVTDDSSASQAMSLSAAQSPKLLQSGYIDLHQRAITAAAHHMSTATNPNTRYRVDFDATLKKLDAFVSFTDPANTNMYLAWMLQYMVYDNNADMNLTAYSMQVFPPVGEYYDDAPTVSITPRVRWLLQNSIPFHTLTEVQQALGTAGLSDPDPTTLKEEDIYFATQLAIWNSMSSVSTWDFSVSSPAINMLYDKYPNVEKLYNFILSLTGEIAAPLASVDLTVAPTDKMTYNNNRLGPFVVKSQNLLPQYASTAYTISLSADRQGLEAQVIDKDGNPLATVSDNQEFWIRITNYHDLPASTDYKVRIVAQSVDTMAIVREGVMHSAETALDYNNSTTSTADLVYAYNGSGQLRGAFTFEFVTSKSQGYK